MIRVISYSSDRTGILIDADSAVPELRGTGAVLVCYKDRTPVAWFANWAYAYKTDNLVENAK
jgi:hypothetical protein